MKNSKATNKIEKLIYNIIRQNNKFIKLTIVKKIPRLTILVLHAFIREPPQINLKTKHNSINKDGKRCRFFFFFSFRDWNFITHRSAIRCCYFWVEKKFPYIGKKTPGNDRFSFGIWRGNVGNMDELNILSFLMLSWLMARH